jgi:dTDP-4-dehydrorhamnose reductase
VDAKSSFHSGRTLIIGRYGRLARAFRYLYPQAKALGRTDIDIRDCGSVSRAVEWAQPLVIINCAAITDVALCERDSTGTRAVNVEGVSNLAKAAETAGAILVHFSSDYATNPVNEYGRSKLESEHYADLTIRAKIYDGSHWAWDALRNRRQVRMTTQEFSNPISTTGVAGLIPRMLGKKLRGVVKVGTVDRLEFFQIGQIWTRVLGVSSDLVVPTGSIESPYLRPADTYLPVDELCRAGIGVPTLEADAENHKDLFQIYMQADGTC